MLLRTRLCILCWELVLNRSNLVLSRIRQTTNESILINRLIYLKTIFNSWSSIRLLNILVLGLNRELLLIISIVPRFPQILKFSLLSTNIWIHSSRAIGISPNLLTLLIPVLFWISHGIKITIRLETLLLIDN